MTLPVKTKYGSDVFLDRENAKNTEALVTTIGSNCGGVCKATHSKIVHDYRFLQSSFQ